MCYFFHFISSTLFFLQQTVFLLFPWSKCCKVSVGFFFLVHALKYIVTFARQIFLWMEFSTFEPANLIDSNIFHCNLFRLLQTSKCNLNHSFVITKIDGKMLNTITKMLWNRCSTMFALNIDKTNFRRWEEKQKKFLFIFSCSEHSIYQWANIQVFDSLLFSIFNLLHNSCFTRKHSFSKFYHEDLIEWN